jgi:hypothetical protein
MSTAATDRPKRKDRPPPTKLAKHVGEVLAAARGEQSLREVTREARGSGIATMQHVDLLRLERGEENPTLARVEQWAKALGGHLEVTFVPDDEDDG